MRIVNVVVFGVVVLIVVLFLGVIVILVLSLYVVIVVVVNFGPRNLTLRFDQNQACNN